MDKEKANEGGGNKSGKSQRGGQTKGTTKYLEGARGPCHGTLGGKKRVERGGGWKKRGGKTFKSLEKIR